MTVELVTGHAGSAHVSSADAGMFNAGVVGSGKYVLDTGAQLACEVQSANLVTVGVGDAVFEGRHVRVSATENVSIDNGAQGVSRNDIVCLKYEYDNGTSTESASIAVIKGTAVSGTPSDPTIPSGSILNGSSTAYMPLWRIPIDGITVNTPEKMFGDVIVPLSSALSATWQVAQIPNLPASKTTSGTFDAARIPNLSANKITSDTLPVARGGTAKTSGTAWMADTLYNVTPANATTSSVALSASAANYTMMEIYFRDNDAHYSSTKVYGPNGKTVNLSMSVGTTNGGMNHKRREVSISGTTISTQSYAEQAYDGTIASVNHIYIYAVVGYK